MLTAYNSAIITNLRSKSWNIQLERKRSFCVCNITKRTRITAVIKEHYGQNLDTNNKAYSTKIT